MSGRPPGEGLERRVSLGELRADADDRKLRGYAIVFNQLSLDLGGFRERILPSAVTRTLKDALDVRALIDHDPSKIIGRTRAGTLELRKDGRGLKATIDPPNTTVARDLMESVGRGDISGMSFAFRTLEDDWHMEDGEPVREVMDMEIREVSIVSFPAYPQTDVAVAVRSLTAFQATQKPRHSLDWWRRWHKTQLAR
jgi:HK97 family phage prohead protease